MEDLLKRITFDKDVLCGKPLIRGLRISIEMLLELLAKGATEQEILEDYPELEPDDIRAALIYAHCMGSDRSSLRSSQGPIIVMKFLTDENRGGCKYPQGRDNYNRA